MRSGVGWGLLIPREKLHCRCHPVTDNNGRYFIIMTGVRVEGKAALPMCSTIRILTVMMKELRLW